MGSHDGDEQEHHHHHHHIAFSDLRSRFESLASAGGHPQRHAVHTAQSTQAAPPPSTTPLRTVKRPPPPRPPKPIPPSTRSHDDPLESSSSFEAVAQQTSFADLRSRFQASEGASSGLSAGLGSRTPIVDPRVPTPSRRRSSGAQLSSDAIAAVTWAENGAQSGDLNGSSAEWPSQSQPLSQPLSQSQSQTLPLPQSLPPPPPPQRPPIPPRTPMKPSSSTSSLGVRSASNPVTLASNTIAPASSPSSSRSHTPTASMSAVTHSSSMLSPPPAPPLLRSASSGSRSHDSKPRPPIASRPPLPPPRPTASASSSSSFSTSLYAPPPMRTAKAHSTTTHPTRPPEPPTSSSSDEDDDDADADDDEANTVGPSASPDVLPDVSRANRRPPSFHPPRVARSKHFHCFAVSGHTVCTASGDKVRVYRVGSTALNGDTGDKLCSLAAEHGGKEVKITAMAFKPPAGQGDADAHASGPARYLWCGTREGTLCEMDIATATIVNSRHNVHTAAVVRLRRAGDRMLSMDESGKICTWMPQQSGEPLSLSQQPIAQRVSLEKSTVVLSVGSQVWAATGGNVSSAGLPSGHSLSSTVRSLGNGVGSPPSSLLSSSPLSPPSSAMSATTNGPRIRIFNPFSITMPFNATSRPLTMPPELSRAVGAVTCGTVVPAQPNLVYLGHESGYVSVWDRTRMACLRVQRLSTLAFTAIAGVGEYLWTGNRSGRITIYASAAAAGGGEEATWRVIKSWPAHRGPVTSLYVDSTSLYASDVPSLQVASAGLDYNVHLWDGLLSADWLADRLSRRSEEFSTYRDIRTLHVSFNIDASSPLDLQTSAEAMDWLPSVLTGDGTDPPPEIIYFGFQEVVDLEDKRLTAKSMIWNAASGGKKARAKAKAKAKEARESAHDAASAAVNGSQGKSMDSQISHQYRMWYDKLVSAVRLAMPPDCPYRVVHSENLVGLFTCTFVRADESVNARDVAVAKVKTGLGGRWGNKGAIVSRLVLDDTSCCFINAHLAAGQKHVKQRNEDIAVIMEAESLPCSSSSGTAMGQDAGMSTPLAYMGGGAGELILDHEVVFFSGDLNYRIDLTRSQVLSSIGAGTEDERRRLYDRDQLYTQLTRGGPLFRLRGFEEAQWSLGNHTHHHAPPFWPTYKFDPGTTQYDTSEKNRIPAWCDRVLYRSPSEVVTTQSYTSWPSITISDHRPISARFAVRVKKIDDGKRSIVEEEERGALRERVERDVAWCREYYEGTGLL